MNPENVNPSNFRDAQIVYNNGEFSIAYGTWENGNRVLGMRWNGEDNNDPGFPKVFRNPMWFIIDSDLHLPFLRSLVGISNSDSEKLLTVLEEIISN